jgi:signal transduction histidine kinase
LTASESRANRSTIQLFFLGLAGLTLLVLGLSYGLFHHLALRYEDGVVLNRENAEDLSRVDHLENLEAELDAPGNDIFLSRNVQGERKRVIDAGAAFRKEAQSLKEQLLASRDTKALEKLDLAVASAAEVERDAYQTIDAFSRSDLAAASQAMAAMDQAHTRVFDPLQKVATALRAKESLSFRKQESEFTSIGQQEKIIAIALLLLTAAIVIYGRRAAREMITASRERETYVERLEEREQALHTAIQQRDHQTRNFEEAQLIAGLGSWEWDVSRNRVLWTQELHRIFGTSPESFGASYESYLSRVHPGDRERVDLTIRASMENRVPFELEHRAIRPDGSVIILAFRGNVECDASGSVVRMYGIAHDISAATLFREAQSANRYKDSFLGTVAHELRTPLTSITGWIELAKMNPDMSAEAVFHVDESVRLLKVFTEDLLDITRIREQKLNVEMTEIDLAAVVRSALEVTALSASGHGIQIRQHLELDPAPLRGDHVRLLQVVWNLLSNAIKFTPPGGEIDVRLEADGSNARLSVIDTGAGISADFLPHVFELYRQAEATATHLPGLGIGLSIVANIVKLHGGTVRVESPGVGLGSTFIVTLPLSEPRPAIAPSSTKSEPVSGRSSRTGPAIVPAASSKEPS